MRAAPVRFAIGTEASETLGMLNFSTCTEAEIIKRRVLAREAALKKLTKRYVQWAAAFPTQKLDETYAIAPSHRPCAAAV